VDNYLSRLEFSSSSSSASWKVQFELFYLPSLVSDF
jgi:hypothetical protein